MSVSVTITGGAPPPDLAPQMPGISVDELAKLEGPLFKHLRGNPADAARFLDDPAGLLRKVVPQAGGVLTAIEARQAAARSSVPDGGGVELTGLRVDVEKPDRRPKPPRDA